MEGLRASERTADEAQEEVQPTTTVDVAESGVAADLVRLHRQWEASLALAAKRRGMRTRAGAVVALILVGALAFLVATERFGLGGSEGSPAVEKPAPPGGARAAILAPERLAPPAYPPREEIASARTFAESREGPVSFAVIDSRGREHALGGDRSFVAASVVKVMLLVAEVERLEAAGLPLDAPTRSLLERMVTFSDNAAADSIYARVGDSGLFEVARRAGLRDFTVAGYWANAQLTARDMALLMSKLDALLRGPHAAYASGALERVVLEQRWGIPAAVAGGGWRQRFKGGWRGTEAGQLVHQVARLDRGEMAVSLAVLSDGAPSMDYGIATVRGIADRLFSRPPARERPAPPAAAR